MLVPVPLAERARGAERVVVGRVASVAPQWQVNEFGDQLIVSLLRVAFSETLKGDQAAAVDVEVEGGTIGQLTLRLRSDSAGCWRPGHFLPEAECPWRIRAVCGQGLIRLDASNRVPGSSLTLDVIRREELRREGPVASMKPLTVRPLIRSSLRLPRWRRFSQEPRSLQRIWPGVAAAADAIRRQLRRTWICLVRG